jgi:heat shock protein HslJ
MLLFALVVLSLTACGNSSNDTKDATAGLPDVLQNLTANPWRLDPAASSVVIPGAGPITIVFGTGHVLTGSEACGSYRATFKLDEDTLTIASLSRTKRDCSKLNEAAAGQYFAALGRVHHVQPTTRDHLRLTGGSHFTLAYNAQTFKEP